MSLALKKKFPNKEFDMDKASDRAIVARSTEADFSDSPSLTSQSFADEVNINKIMARVEKGQIVLGSDGMPFYGDVSELGGLQEALIKVQEAEELFMQFPAETREVFENDPLKMVQFLEDPSNKEKAIQLGLVKPKPEVVTPPVPEPGANPPA